MPELAQEPGDMCMKSINTGLTAVWTASTVNATVEHPVTEKIPRAQLVKGWVTVHIRRQSGNCGVRAGLRWSDDGVTWGAATGFGPAAVTAEGYTHDTTFVTLTALGTPKRFGQLVIIAVNASGNEVEYCAAGLEIQLTGTD